MAAPISRPVRFKTISAKALMLQLDGPEQPYPVYRMGNTLKFERPEVPGAQYRWITS